MPSISRLALITVLLLFSLTPVFAGDDITPSASRTELEAADRLFRAGKFAEAEARYQEILKSDATSLRAQTGCVRTMLKQQKIDESLNAVNSALAAQPNSATLLAVKGDVHFRRGEMSDAESSFIQALKSDPKEIRAYLGLARLYRVYSLYRQAYEQLRRAHEIAPDDIEVKREWLGMLSRRERLAALEAYLRGPHPDDEQETRRLTEYLEFLKATAEKPVHACRLVSKVERTETELQKMLVDPVHMRGIGLSVKLNDRNARLLLDTGAGGIMVTRTVAEKAGATFLTERHYSGIGDKGAQEGHTAVVDHIRIGKLEFQDCVVEVSDRRSIADEDGLISADVFANYLIDLDLPDMRLKLSPLPKRPEDAAAPTSLNSEKDDTAVEHKEDSESGDTNAQQPSASPKPAPHLPADRYVAPEMANWTRVFRFGHLLLVPTSVNESKAMLFGLDTGASSNLLSTRAGRQTTKVSSNDNIRVRGLSGTVNNVYTSEKAVLRFGYLRQQNQDLITIDLSDVSRHLGTEVSGFLGFAMLRLLDVKLDYRDGLVDFTYDPKRLPALR